MSATDELLPCPFCGGRALTYPITMDALRRVLLHTHWRVKCTKCGVQMLDDTDRDKVVAAWNRRAN